MPRILIADDQADVLAALSLLLKGERFQIESASSPEGVLRSIDLHEFDVVLIDLNYARDTTSGSEGLDLLSRIRAVDPTLPVVVMTAWGSVDLAVEAMRRGARDFIQKPWDNARLLAVLRTQIELGEALRRGKRLEAENIALRDSVSDSPSELPQIVSESPAMRSVLNLVERIGPADANVLITGENGTGKEVITRVLHSISSRRSKPLISLNAGALAEGVFESELFGHVRGAFTDAKSDRVGRFELADGGTLFLDEIGDLDLTTQVKLLRVLQEREFERLGGVDTIKVNVRLIVATNKNLEEAIKRSQFREDLYYRLNVFTIFMPPLRERKPDILLLAEHFVEKFEREHGKSIKRISTPAIDMLTSYHWPGNVRELENVIERAVLICDSNVIHGHHLPPSLQTAEGSDTVTRLSLTSAIEAYERDLIQDALKTARGNRAKAAKLLDSTERIIGYKVKKYGLRCERYRS